MKLGRAVGSLRVRSKAVPILVVAAAVVQLVLAVLGTVLESGNSVAGLPGQSTPLTWSFTAALLAFPAVGTAIVLRRPDQRFGWLYAFGAAGFFAWNVTDAYARRALLLAPGTLPLGDEAAWLSTFVWVPSASALLSFGALLFPDGRPPSPRWRPAVAALAAAPVLVVGLKGAFLWPIRGVALLDPAAVDRLPPGAPAAAHLLLQLAIAAFGGGAVVGAAAIAVRYRRSRGAERQQMKLFVIVAALLAVALPLADAGPFRYLDSLALAALPIAVGVAVLRHGLYDIDRLLNRTLVYAVVSGGLAAVFLVLTTALGALLPTDSSLGVAMGTLVAAAAFRPLRDRVQREVDRRFDRARYDARATAEAYRARLRNDVDLDAVSAGLVEAVATTVVPTRVGLWLAEQPR